jgi:hypothetical protein
VTSDRRGRHHIPHGLGDGVQVDTGLCLEVGHGGDDPADPALLGLRQSDPEIQPERCGDLLGEEGARPETRRTTSPASQPEVGR